MLMILSVRFEALSRDFAESGPKPAAASHLGSTAAEFIVKNQEQKCPNGNT